MSRERIEKYHYIFDPSLPRSSYTQKNLNDFLEHTDKVRGTDYYYKIIYSNNISESPSSRVARIREERYNTIVSLHHQGILCDIPNRETEKLEKERRDLISHLQYVKDECERLNIDFDECLKDM